MQLANIGICEEQITILDQATDFCRNRAPMDKVRALMTSALGYDAQLWEEMAALGWLGIAIPDTYEGGLGLSLAEVVPIAEQMGRRLLSSPFISTILAAQVILAGGNVVQQAQWLPRLALGAIGTLALNEAHGDWNVTHIETTAVRKGDRLVLSGQKLVVQWGRACDVLILSVLLDGLPALVLLEAEDIVDEAMRDEQLIDETRRSVAILLDGIEVPAQRLMPQEHAVAALNHIELASGLLQSAEMVGGTQAVIDYTLDYMRTRTQFGNVIGGYQALKHPMVNAYVDYEKARSLLYSAAHSFSEQGQGEIAVRMAKAAADTTYAYAADRAVQFHGGFGFTHDCDAGLHRRAAIFQASQLGDAVWQRAKLKRLLFG